MTMICGAANLFVVIRLSENAWVNFKMFGLPGFAFVFIIGQMLLLKDFVTDPKPEPATVEGGDETPAT